MKREKKTSLKNKPNSIDIVGKIAAGTTIAGCVATATYFITDNIKLKREISQIENEITRIKNLAT